ncbi:MAG: hypothetical protein ACLTKI_08655, partial [Lachnospiraceae bacterium]
IEDFREDAAQKIGNLRMEAAQRMDLDIDPEALSKRMDALRERQKALLSHMNFYGRGLLKGNPTASSKRFADALKEFKEHVESKINE